MQYQNTNISDLRFSFESRNFFSIFITMKRMEIITKFQQINHLHPGLPKLHLLQFILHQFNNYLISPIQNWKMSKISQ